MPLRVFCLFFSLLLTLSAEAAPTSRAEALKLADTDYWRLLLRYEPARTASGWRSEAENDVFFLSPDGRDNPVAELSALLDALTQPASDDAPACRFPARLSWLREQLGEAAVPRVDCPAFMTWMEAIQPHQATLVFASDFLNNPSSMFGHTLLRLDRAEQNEDTRLLAYALNYAAVVEAPNPLSYAWNGLTGGYPGVYSLMPYYEKVKEYSDMESRDLWEYQLSFTPAELQRLMEHVWELRRVEFPYYFLTRNCSFQLLGLFEVARPGLAMRKDFPLQAIPADTVRRVVAEAGLLRKVVYRPSAQQRLLQSAHDNAPRVNRQALDLARSAQTPPLPDAREEAAALEAAYDFRYYQFLAGDQTPEARQDLRQLLHRRAAIDLPDQRHPPTPPTGDPISGHPTARLALAAGHERDTSYAALRLRPAYHDLLDAPKGYRHGARIDFLDTELRLDSDRNTLRLEQLNLVSVDSLAPWDMFFRPWSWFLGTGLRQAAVDRQGRFSPDESHGVAYFEAGAGGDSSLTDDLECYLQLAGNVESGGSLAHGWRVGAGPRAGCLYTRQHWRLRLQVDSRYHNDAGRLETRSLLEGQMDLDTRNALRLRLGQLQRGGDRSGIAEAGWVHYF